MSKVWEFVSCLSMADWPRGGGEGKNTQLGQAKMAEAGLLMVPDAALGQRRALFISLHKHSRPEPATPKPIQGLGTAYQLGSRGCRGFTSSKEGAGLGVKPGSYFEKVSKAGTLKLEPWFLKRHWRHPRSERGALQCGM